MEGYHHPRTQSILPRYPSTVNVLSAAWYHTIPQESESPPAAVLCTPPFAPLPCERSGPSSSQSACCRAYAFYITLYRYIYRSVLVGVRLVPSTRHEALEKRRWPRMYFLIIDFNDEGSRWQRHLGCWAE